MPGDPLHTRLCDDFGLEFPIIAFTHCKDVVVAVVNAGGLAVFGATGKWNDELSADIQWIKSRVGSKPFGIDILMPASGPANTVASSLAEKVPSEHRAFIAKVMKDNNIPEPKPIVATEARESRVWGIETAREQMDVVLSHNVPVIVSGLGNPAWALEAAHARGAKFFGLIGNVRQAVREAEAGIDYIIAQGYDAGGHTGEIGSFSLTTQVVSAVGKTPVLMAGGVGNGRQLAAALCLGAVGVWTGTLWLACKESDTEMHIKQKILAAAAQDTSRAKFWTGKTNRQLRTRYSDAWEQPGSPAPLPMPLQGLVGRDLNRSVRENNMHEWIGGPAGQTVGLINEMKPAAQIVFDMVEEARDTFDRLQGMPVAR